MSSTLGKRIRLSIFGESHGEAVGVVIDGFPAGETIDAEALQAFLDRRAPGRASYQTSRKESDVPVFLSGLKDQKTTGAPICAIIRNRDMRAGDYDTLADLLRPSHADYPAHLRYLGFQEMRGGGHFSGRLTAPLVLAGGCAIQALERRGVTVGAHIARIASAEDTAFDPARVQASDLQAVSRKRFSVIDGKAGEKMLREIESAREARDSVGGVIECAVVGFPGGIGTPMFDGLENRLAAALFGIPAVRGVEFGAGFSSASMRGSVHNDRYLVQDGKIVTETNRHGGIIGGISTGMPILLRVAVKPTPSIGVEQHTVRLSDQRETMLAVKGRHDPCIVPRAVPCVEAAVGMVLLDLLYCETEERRPE